MTNVVLDAETYYSAEISVTKMGTPNYVANSEAYIWGVAIQGGEAFCGTLAEVGPMMEQLAKDPAVQPIAANSGFDSAFFEKYWPAFHKPWFCVLDQAAWQQCPRNLAGLSGAILGEKVDKTIRDEMRGKRYEDLPAEEQVKVQEYCLNDAVKELEVFEAMKPMSSFEAEVAAHTRMINRRGVQIDMELLARDKTRLEKMRFDALRSIPWYRDAKPLSHSALAEYCNAHGIPVPKSTAKDDDECDDMMTDSPELAVIIGYMRRFRKANTMLRKCSTLDARVDAGGILALDLLYCGAPHTRRWSSKGFNIQNLDKEPLKTGVDGETVWTRNWIIPRPGFIFYIADYAQIEPRCLNYLAGNEEMMAALRTGFSYYEAYSRAAKGWKGAAGTLKKEFGKERYTKLKNEALGCGYGMGPEKYTSYAGCSIEEAKRVVEGFRANNQKVVRLWHRLDGVIASAAREKDRHMELEMLSGDVLEYFNIRRTASGHEGFVTKNDFGAMSKQNRLWGGTLTENITQRMARDVMAHAIVNLEKAGLPVAFHVHDEIILELPIDGKEEAARAATEIMRQAPEWAPDLPLEVEGDFATAYTK